MKRLTSIVLALIMAVTVYAVPAVGAYADDEAVSSDTLTTDEEITSEEPTEETEPSVEATDPTQPTESVKDEEGAGSQRAAKASSSSSSTTKATTTTKTSTTSPTTTTKQEVVKKPGKVDHFSSVRRTSKSITVEFTSAKNAKKYRIYRRKNGKWVKVTTVISEKREITIYHLNPATGYKFKIVPYNVSKDKKRSVAGPGRILRTATRPGKVKLVSVTKSFPALKAEWKEKKGSGYEIWVSKYSNFKNKKKIKIKSKDKLKKKIWKLTNGKRYYVKVRAVYEYNDRTFKGKWSKTKSSKVKSTGWYKKKGRKYYYKNGSKIKGYHKFNGTRLYFLKSTGELVGVSPTMWKKVNGHSSRTKYFIAVSKKYNRFVVYKAYGSHWCVYKYGPCTTGKPSTPSPSGYFSTTGRDKISFGDGFTCWYATNITGQVYFHSVICSQGTKYAAGGQLGRSLSHGCIRLSLGNAYWIYKNIGKGTKVVIY